MNLSGKMIVVKSAANPEAPACSFAHNTCNFAYAFDTHFPAALVRGGKQNFDPYFASHRGAPAGENECTIQCNIRGEAPFGVVTSIVPVEDDGQPQPISNGCSALQSALYDGHQFHI